MGFTNRTIRRLVAVAAIAVTAFALTPPTLMAQSAALVQGGASDEQTSTEPVVVVTLGSINKLTQDVNYLTQTMGQGQAGGMFAMMAGTFTQGIDPTQPIGVLVSLVNGAPQPIALVPTADVKTVLKRLEAQTGPADELDDGTLVIAVGASTVFIRQTANWAVLAPQRELLDLAPADPLELFEGMGNDFDLAFRLKMQQVPAETRGILVAQIRQGFEQAMAQQSPAEAEMSRQMTEGSLEQLEQLINETDTLQFGFNVDQVEKNISVSISFSAVPGSDLADVYGGQQAIPSRFASVIREDAAAYYHGATAVSPQAVAQTRTTLNTYLMAINNAIAGEDNLSADQQEDLQEIVKRIGDLFISSIDEGKADFGALLLANRDEFGLILGAFVSDGNEVAAIVKDMAEKVQGQPGAPRFKFDESTYKDIAMHVVEADVPANEDEARRVFGDTLRLHIGTGPKVVYVAIGDNSESLMKELIDAGMNDNVGDRPVAQMKVRLLPILEYAQSIESDDALTAMIDALAQSPDPGVLTIVSNAVENGAESKVTIGEGLLQAIGAAVRQAQQAAFQGQF